MKIDDVVCWTSSSQGFKKHKIGTIVAIVPAGMSFKKCVPEGMFLRSSGLPRNHESYLVMVGKHKSNLYWPNAKKLEKIGIRKVKVREEVLNG